MTKLQAPPACEPLLAAKHDEESQVRHRSGEVEVRVPRSAPGPELDSTRPQRLARAVRFAKLMLDALPPDDSARGLLEIAIRRNDEALLEAILKDLHREQRRREETSPADENQANPTTSSRR